MAAPKSHKVIPTRCYNRVKGLLFLDEHFKPTSHKTFIAPKDLFFGLLCRGSGPQQQQYQALKTEFEAKLKDWHELYDDEEHYEGVGEMAGDMVHWTQCRCAGASYAQGDRITVKQPSTRKKLYGTVVRFETRSDDGNEATNGWVVVNELSTGDLSKFSSRMIEGKPSEAAWKNAEKEVAKSTPARLKWVNYATVGHAVSVDESIPEVIVQVQNSSKDPVHVKPNVGVRLRIFRSKPKGADPTQQPPAKKHKKSSNKSKDTSATNVSQECTAVGAHPESADEVGNELRIDNIADNYQR